VVDLVLFRQEPPADIELSAGHHALPTRVGIIILTQGRQFPLLLVEPQELEVNSGGLGRSGFVVQPLNSLNSIGRSARSPSL
jgi:hypothetical protein